MSELGFEPSTFCPAASSLTTRQAGGPLLISEKRKNNHVFVKQNLQKSDIAATK